VPAFRQLGPAVRLYVATTIVASLALVVAGFGLHPLSADTTIRIWDATFTQPTLPTLLYLAVGTQIAALLPIRSSNGVQYFFDPILVATGLFAPGGGVGFVAWLATFDGRLPSRRNPLWVLVSNRAMTAISHVIPSLAVSTIPRDAWWSLPLQTGIYVVALIAINYTGAALTLSLANRSPFWTTLARNVGGLRVLVSSAILAFSGAVLFFLVLTPVGMLIAPALFGFILAVRGNIANAQRQAELRDHTLELAATALDARDRYTQSHSIRVAELAARLGEGLGLGARECDLLHTAGSLHDLGMIGIRDDILSKPGPLNDQEWEIVRRHPDIGADMVAQHLALAEVAPLVRHHHERWDGTGYPVGLKGEAIPFGARILAVAESFDAITVERVYRRNHMTTLDAVRDISSHAGSWYDQGVVDALRALYPHPAQAVGAPLAQASEILRGDREVPVAAKPSGTADVGSVGPSVTVLVADDNVVAVRLCQRVLEKAGYKVLTAFDGVEAVSVALANSPDVILMDVAMPGIDGLEATRQIKKQRPSIAIVIASVLATPSNRERFLASGADDVMMKPFRLTDMLTAVAKVAANRGRQMNDLTGTRLGSDEKAHDQLEQKAQRHFQELNRVGRALSAERNILKSQDSILTTMRRLTNADSASLWLITVGDDGEPRLFLSASQSTSIDSPYQAFNVPVDEASVVGYAVMTGSSLVYDDAYNPPPGKPHGGKGFDAQYGYRTKSMLTVPMRNYNNEVVGAVQLINAKRSLETKLTVDNVPDEVVSFSSEDLEMIESIASQAAIAIDNKNLSDSIELLLDDFVRTSLSALQLRDPTSAGRAYRVEALTTGLARAVSHMEVGKYRDVRLTEDQLKELRYACLLHDIGKIGVREHILVKTKKLLPGQLEAIQARFDFIVRSAQVKFATEKLDVKHNGKGTSQTLEDIDGRLAQEIDQLHRWLSAVVQANEPSVLTEEAASILEQLSKQTYSDLSGTAHPMLDPQEFSLLSIRRGVLDPEERLEMESHVTYSFQFVNTIPWPPSMRNIPEIVYTHHERLDGSGYPRGLTGDQISVQTRMLTIADIYDALTVQDRPYKRAVPAAVALEILRAEANAGKLDKDLLDIFVTKEVFLISADRPAAVEAPTAPMQKRDLVTSTPEMQDEMRKLIEAARSAVADLDAADPSAPHEPPTGLEFVKSQGIAANPTTLSSLEMQEEMRKLIEAARKAVADLQVAVNAWSSASRSPKASSKRSSRKRN
jgi:response regulator RpfG family c-di-GMP phosphodiesterase